jgi:hypothetical protein
MAFLPPAIFEIKAVADKAIAEFKQVNNELGKMEDQSMKAGGSIGGIDKASRVATAGLLAMGAAFAGFAALGIKEAMDAEVIMTKLNATLTAQGLNTAATRAEIDALASSFVQLGFDDEAAAASMQILIQSTGDLAKSKQLLGMAADLARAKSISLEAASQMLVKANMGAGKVFKQFGVVLDTTLPKAEATAKAMAELKAKMSGQAQKATETLTVQLAILKEQFNNAAQSVGTVLIPKLKTLVENFNKVVGFVKRNSTAFQIFGGIILTVTAAVASYSLTLKVITIATKAWAFIQGVAKAATAALTGQQIALNGAMAINPIGLIVMAVVLLIGAFVLLWNKCEPFRKIMIEIGKVGVKAFGFLIGLIGDLATGFIKIATGPLKLLLKGLSLLGVDAAGKALAGLESATDSVGEFFDKAAKKVTGMADSLDKLNKPIKIDLLKTEEPVLDDQKATGGLTPEAKAAAKAAKDATKKANEDYMKIVKDFQGKIVDAQTKFTEKMKEIDKDYAKETAKLNKDAAEKISKLNKDAAEKKLKAEIDTNKKITEAQTRFNEDMGKLNAKRADDLAKLTKDNQNKIASITKSGNDKLASIVQRSVDRLRDAFAKGTEFKITDLFKGLVESGSANADDLLEALKKKLFAAKNLAENAAFLQANGFSQTFIEEIVSAGPEVGNKLAESILNASPETMRALQATFLDMENTQDAGLDALATEMNKGARLATNELNLAYKDAQQDLADLLLNQAQQYAEGQVEINKTFNESMAEAEKTRDSAIASLKADLAETIAEIDKDLANSLVEVNKDLQEALGEAFIKFKEAQDAAKKDLTDTLAEIEKEMVEKLGSITNATNATVAAIKALGVALASAKSFTAPTVPAVPSTPSVTTPSIYAQGGRIDSAGNYNAYNPEMAAAMSGKVSVTQNITYPTASASEISAQTLSAIKFGTSGGHSFAGSTGNR